MILQTEHLILDTRYDQVNNNNLDESFGYTISAKIINEKPELLATVYKNMLNNNFVVDMDMNNFTANICDFDRYKEFVLMLDTIEERNK